MIIGGVDEAGRGPVFGPMIMALVVVDEKGEKTLRELGVRDSKQLSPKRREELYPEILKIAKDVVIARVEPFEIDAYVSRRSLNELEAMKIAEMITKAKAAPELLIVDAPDSDPSRFAQRIRKYVDVNVLAEHEADEKYPVVSAASIVAKVIRDRIIREIEELYGSFGSGYSHDPTTRAFLEEWVRKYGKLPPFARKSWQTSEKELNKHLQKTLLDWR